MILASFIFCATNPTLKLAGEVVVEVVLVMIPVVKLPPRSVIAVPDNAKFGDRDVVVFVNLTTLVCNVQPILTILAALI